MAADVLGEAGVAVPQAEQEPSGECLVQGALRGGGRDRVAGVDVGHAGGHGHVPGGRQEDRGLRHGLPSRGLGEPQGAVAEVLDRGGGLTELGCGKVVEVPRPDPDASEAVGAGAHTSCPAMRVESRKAAIWHAPVRSSQVPNSIAAGWIFRVAGMSAR